MGTFALRSSSAVMSTEQKAIAGMKGFVIVISGIAALVAGIYIVFWTPGEPEVQPTANAINRSE
ncbi:hypothetical protein [Shinella sp. BE166]|uniref:hypothetical protein n=1 Tax=unclassified Shinella TaxID=2643062 RepID=UPI003EB82697